MTGMALERGLLIHSSCIWRWVQIYGPELDRRCRLHLKRTNKSYRVDETYIRIKVQDRYLYGAVDSTGQTIDFLLTAKRYAAAPSASFVRLCSTLPMRSLGSSTWTRTGHVRRPWRNSRSKAHCGAAVDYVSANT